MPSVTIKRKTAVGYDELYPTTDWSQINNLPSTFTPTSHTHGNITNTGTITADTAIASTQKFVLVNGSNQIVRSALAIGTSTTTFLRNDGTFATPNLVDLGGTLSVGKGGTGVATLTSGNLLVGAGTSAITSVTPKDLTDLGQLSSSSVVPTLERAVYYGTHQREIGVSSAIANSTSFTTISFTSGMRDFWLYIHQDSTTGSVIARIPLTITSAQSIGTATPGKQHRVAWSNGTVTQVMNVDIFFSGTTMSFRHNFTGASLAFRWFGY
jgi:hypothetical protein